MNIYNLPFQHKNNIKSQNIRYNPNFSGNINRTVQTIQFSPKVMSEVSELSKHYRQFHVLYKAAGEYVGDFLKKGINLLAPVGLTAITLRGVLNSEDVKDVKLEREDIENDEKELLSLTLGKGQNNDALRISVAKSGQANIFADEDLSESTLNGYLQELEKNHDKLFDALLDRTEDSMNKINKILEEKTDYDFDLNLKPEIQKVVEEFIDKKKRVTILSKLVDRNGLVRRFNRQQDIQLNVRNFVLNDDITFSYSGLSNSTYDGIGLLVTNKKTGENQGFVAMNDGNIYKTRTFKSDEYINSKIWLMHNLKALTPEELQNPDLKYMFNYVCMHNDRLCRAMLGMFYRKGHADIAAFDSANEKSKARSVKAEEKPFAEETAKTIKLYNISPELTEKVRQMSDYMRRITEIYGGSIQKKCEMLNKNSGFIRRKYNNGIILKDVMLDGKMRLGVTKHSYSDEVKSDELLSFGIFDENINEIARFKVMNNGDVKLLVKPGDTLEFAESMENLIKTELQNGLADKVSDKLFAACYYHENFVKVNKYIEHSYSEISVSQAIKELTSTKDFYKFDTGKIRKLKKISETLTEIYRKYTATAYRWQDAFFPELDVQAKRYMCGKLDEFDIIYEATPIENDKFSGIRILTKNSAGIWTNCYAINDEGDVYKLIRMPKEQSLKRLSGYLYDQNFSPLDENALKAEHVDLIFQNLYNTITVYSDFMSECTDRRDNRRGIFTGRVLAAKVQEYKDILDRMNGKEVDFSQRTMPEQKKTPVHKPITTEPKKRGRPKKDSSEVTQKQTTDIVKRKPGRPKRNPSDVTPKPVRKVTTKPVEQPKVQKTDSVVTESPKRTTEISSVRPFMSLSLEDAVARINKILSTPYEKRSPHLVHDLKSNGDVFVNRFSVSAPDGAWVTVSVMQSGMSSHYYSIRVQKDNEVMYMNLNPETGRIYRCDADNNIIFGDDGHKLTILKEKFAEKNPLSANMSMYFDELFAERPEAQRKTIPWQIFKKQDAVAKQAMHDFERAMRRTSAPEAIQKEIEAEFKEEQEPEEQFDEPEEE